MTPVAIYVHVPFCPSKCGYCDFNSYAMEGDIMARTVDAMVTEIERSPWRGRSAKTIFFGGGTPTYLPEALLVRLIKAVLTVHPPVEGAEITSEANPGTVDMPKFRAMRRAGFNRISLGAQSFVPEDLVRLGRVHQASHIGRAVTSAREAGFDNLNLDLMFALPGQSSRAWEQNLDLALSLQPDHLSLYCLTIEPNTRFYKLHRRGLLDLPDDVAQVTMYDEAVARMTAAGYVQYEISNFARPGRECQHNLCYWHGEDYLAYGPGAVGCFTPPEWRGHPARARRPGVSSQDQQVSGLSTLQPYRRHPAGDPDAQSITEAFPVNSEFCERGQDARATLGGRIRYTNMKHPERYCEAIEAGTKLWCEEEVLGTKEREIERLMLGIRLNEGVEAAGVDPVASQKLQDRGWLIQSAGRLKLTPEGRHFCSEVTAELI